ncbi:putative lipase [Papiliotrema laurentii]|uniref:triacylglycerol lipase n=1 Tax=Papiliotrema laurentii TaxID=5418 RepID=A0AAD9L8S6_PAPLA|nr:putative lipase [Papiliotrema laurentii]
MHVPVIASIAQYLLPLLTSSPPAATPGGCEVLTFTPIHAHGHTSHPSSPSPVLLLHNASATQSFFSVPDTSMLSIDESSEVLLDYPRADIASAPLSIRTKTIQIRRPRVRPPSMLSWAHSARRSRLGGTDRLPSPFPLPASPYGEVGAAATNASEVETWVAPDYNDHHGEWEDVEVRAPDVSDRQTLITLAKMTSNAYVSPDSGEWWPVKGWNSSVPFGWEPDADGLRGHVFADAKNETVIISIKGTSAGVLGSGGPTAKNDKFNDNLLFSCCCARVDFSWTPVCDCYAGGYRCEQTCLEDSLVAESVYATVGTNLYNNVTYMYPNATIWLVGHSLGGSVSALIGLSFGAPVVTMEAPGDRLAAARLHLPLPPGMPAEKTGITHVYHTADPIPMGACTGAYSGCYAAGFALESTCHTGQTILYDTVTVKGWAVDVRTHRIGEIINKVLADPWPVDEDIEDKVHDAATDRWFWWGWGRKGPKPGQGEEEGDQGGDDWEKHGGVPKAVAESNCTDCFKWEFGDGWDKKDKEETVKETEVILEI